MTMKTRTIKIDNYKVVICTNTNADSNYNTIVHIANNVSALVGRAFINGTKDIEILQYAIAKIKQFNN